MPLCLKISIKTRCAPHSSPYGDTFPPGGRLDEGNEFNKSSLGSHMLATLPEGESKYSVRAAKGKTSYAPHQSL